ncbi:MMPL family transporter [Dactylosporangium aurantiacum]|uniref:MMPL family transporter n=1 Tax=Dactylosporangium aurantiacum TaxID=35754 RepID=A0A9Q9IA17_9ACTN|nr:MMPL family transporter [Dactylosporangium aurantiacum]MDG6107335.1 MMPL family transporter [Dactylosporangium aurantiacum]UWZ51141.1 MMPL family transporter [Dactylosporangium aurantiacum]
MTAIEHGVLYRLLGRLGRACATRPRSVLAAWLVLIAGLAAAVALNGRPTDNDVTLPGSDAQVARDLLERADPGTRDANAQLVLHAGSGRLDDPARADVLAGVAARIGGIAHVVQVLPPSAERGSLSADGRTGYLTLTFDVPPRSLDRPVADAVLAAAAPARDAGIDTVPGGALAAAADRTGSRTSELLGLAAAVIVLLFAFGGLVAAALPIVTALLTLAGALSVIGLAGHLTGIPAVAATLATMVGLGVGIDYALFLITRHRQQLADGVPVADAVAHSVASSGSAVLFAGGTVVIALGGLAVAEVPLLATLAWTTGIAVGFAVAGAVTLLPAMLAVLGGRIDALRVARRRGGAGRSGWGRLAGAVSRRPWRCALLTTALLGALAYPALDLSLGQIDAGSNPPGSAARQSFDLLAGGFGPGVNGPLTVVLPLDPPATGAADPRLAALTDAVRAVPGVAAAGPAALSGGATATVRVTPRTAPGDPRTAQLVTALRAVRVDGTAPHVGGATATRADLADRLSARMPAVIAVVVALSALLLLLAFRAPVVALKAAVMNLVSIGAAYGALTAVFSWGWGVTLLGLDGPVPVESYVPTMLFALLFGLSMDYEVFLLTAVQEVWQRTTDNTASVREGLAATGRVITSAACIMVVVFASFTLHTDPVIKMFGLGMAVAITVDATVVRGLLVPATMALLGPANWWRPTRRRTVVTGS